MMPFRRSPRPAAAPVCAPCAAGVPCHTHDRAAGAHYDPRPVRTDPELDADFERFLELIGDAQVRIWFCPDGHSERRPGAALRQTVEWRKGVAYCLEPGCERHSGGDPGE